MKTLFFASALTLSSIVHFTVFNNKYTHLLIFFWALSILALLIPFIRLENLKKIKFHFPKQSILIVFMILLPSIARISNYNVDRIHGDDVAYGYFSTTYDFHSTNFFSGIPTDKGQWGSQFPSLFFILQKVFLSLFGESFLSVKLSIIPYVLIISLMIYLITKELLDKETAIIALFIYSFLAISQYFETLGIIFISSTAIFSVFFYFLLRYEKTSRPIFALLSGIACGFCYLFYMSSFIALPLMILFQSIKIVRQHTRKVFANFVLAILGFVIVFGPWFTYNFRIDSYLLLRVQQVSLLSGLWSGGPDRITNARNLLPIVWENTVASIHSFYTNGVGGWEGFFFNHLAFFDIFTLKVFLLGTIIGLFLAIKKRAILGIYLIIVISYISGVILTTPPGSYHRFTLSFPFLDIILSLPFHIILRFKRYTPITYPITIVILLFYAVQNQVYFQKAVAEQPYHESIMISDYINKNFPKRHLHVASYPGFGFDKVYYFSKNKNALSVDTGYHSGYLDNFNPNEKYVYAMIFPDIFDDKFRSVDPNGRIIRISEGYSLFVN